MKPKVRTVKIEDVAVDPAANPRVALNEEHVADLIAAYTAEEDVPPPLCYEVGDDLKLSEGFHRWEALRRLKRIRLTVQVVPGTEDEWAAHTFGSNKGHGLKRTNPDKRRCVELFLKRFPRWANTRIADAAGVGESLVRDVREQHSNGDMVVNNDGEPQPDVRERKDGKTTTVRPKSAKPAEPPPVTPTRREPTPAEVNARGAFPFGHEAPEAEPAEVAEDVPAKLDTDTRQYVREARRVKPGDKDYSRYLVGIYFPAIVKTPKGGTVVIDGAGKPVPARMADGFATPPHREIFEELATIAEAALDLHGKLDKLKAKNDPMLVNPYLDMVAYGQKFETITRAIHDVRDAMRDCLPFVVCPACGAEDGGCKSCRLSGFMPEIDYKDYLQEQKRGAA